MGSSVSTFHNIHLLASGSGGEEAWHHLATSFVATYFSFFTTNGKNAVKQSQVCINFYEYGHVTYF
jgi:hypothetical protein